MATPTPPPAAGYGYGGYGYSVVRRDPTAVMGRRIGAFFIDGAVAFVIGMIIFFVAADHVSLLDAERKYGCDIQRVDVFGSRNSATVDCPDKLSINFDDDVWVADFGPVVGLGFLASFAYYALLPGLTGWTMGKLLVGIRIVDAHGQRASIGRNVVRWVLFIVDSFFFLLPGLIAALTSRGHRRIGDMAAGTFVVAADAVGYPPLDGTPAAAPIPYATQPPMAWPQPAPPLPVQAPPVQAPPPHWDEARSTYLQWDPTSGSWLQWDESRRAWKPIDT